MRNNCVQLVVFTGENLGKAVDLYSLPTADHSVLVAGLNFVLKVATSFTQVLKNYTHKVAQLNPPYYFKVLHISHRAY